MTASAGGVTESSRQERRWRLRVVLFAILIVILFVGEMLNELIDKRARMIEEARQNALNNAISLSHYHNKFLESNDLVFKIVGNSLKNRTIEEANSSIQLGKIIQNLKEDVPELSGMVVYSRDGAIISSTFDNPSQAETFFNKDRAIAILQGKDGRTRIEPPVSGTSPEAPLVPVVRPLRNGAGELAFLGVVALEPAAFFTPQKHHFAFGKEPALLVARSDGMVLARLPHTDIVGKSLSDYPLFRDHVVAEPAGSYVSPPQSDGEVRIVGYRLDPVHELVTAVAIHRDHLLAPWRDSLVGHFWVAFAFVVLVGGGAGFFIRSRGMETRLRFSAESERQRADDRAVKQQILADLSQFMLEAESSEEFLDRTVRSLRKGTGSAFASIARQISSGSRMSIVARDGWPEHARKAYSFDAGADSHVGFALLSRGTVVSNDYNSEKRFRPHVRLAQLGARSGVAMPLQTASGGFSGSLSVYSTTPDAYSDGDRLFVESVGHLVNSYYERRIQSNLRSAILDSVPSLLAVLDQSGEILFVNKTWVSEGDARGLAMEGHGIAANYIDICTRAAGQGAVEARQMQEGIMNVLSGQSELFELEYPCGLGTEMRWYSATVSAVDLDGQKGALVSHLDVTPRREIERQLREASRMEALGQLTGGISHDFNNLLMVIGGNAEMLANRIGSDTLEGRMLAAIREASDRGALLTDRLLSFSRRQMLLPQPIEPQKVLQDVVGLLQRTLREDIELKIEAPDSCHEVLADEAQLHTALMNLILNARDALPNGGTITLRCENLDEGSDPVRFVRISVTDDGEGMSADVAGKAFEPFFTTKAVGEGTGLGLSMVHGFAVQSGGSASLESTRGVGTRVEMDLPVAAESEGVANGGVRSDPAERLDGTILLVEDEDRVRNYLRMLLEEIGLEVHEASSATEALERLRDLPELDLLLSDVIMPGNISGYGLAREIRTRSPGTDIILMSGYADPVMIERLDEHDPSIPLLRKPFSRDQLAALLQSAISDGH